MASRVPNSDGWHLEDIKSALRKRFGSIQALSLMWGYHRGTISAVLRHPEKSLGLELRVAEAIGVPAHVLWPNRWHSDGTSKPRLCTENYGMPRASNSKKREAA